MKKVRAPGKESFPASRTSCTRRSVEYRLGVKFSIGGHGIKTECLQCPKGLRLYLRVLS